MHIKDLGKYKNKPNPKIVDGKNIEEWGRNQWYRNGKKK